MTLRKVPALALLAVLACKPDPAAVHRKAGDDLLSRSDFAGAAAEYAKSLELDAKQEKTWEKLAFCRVKTGEEELAAEALVKTVEFKASDAQRAEVYRNAAGIFLQSPERAKAEAYLLEAVRLDPKDEASITWLGELASEAGGARHPLGVAAPEQLDKAIGYYDRLIELRPNGTAAHVNRRIVVTKYLTYLAEQKRAEQRVLRARDPQAVADARERIARIDAKAAKLQRLLDESNEKLGKGRKAAQR